MPENIPAIQIRGARQHNLKNLDLDIPKNQLTVITGPSGSGKSSLAFHTLYAEGQRRYVETFSPYVRQFLDRMDKPAVDRIDNIPPAIAIEQKNTIRTTRSTVGTLTELNDYLKVIFPKLAKAFDPETGEEIKPDSPASIIEWAYTHHADENLLVTFPIGISSDATCAEVNNFLSQQGYLRVWKNDAVARTDDEADDSPWGAPTATVIQDRIKLTASNKTRLHEALEAALNYGKGHCALMQPAPQSSTSPNNNSQITNNGKRSFSTTWLNPNTGFSLQPPTASLFSFNSPLGACPECRGFGRIIGVDLEKAVQDPTLTIREGVIKPFEGERGAECKDDLIRCAIEHGIDTNTPWHQLTKKQQEWILKGEKGNSDKLWKAGKWYGVRGFFDWMETKAYKMHVRVFLSRYRAYTACPACNATRLKPEALCFKVEGKTLPDLWHIPLEELLEWFQALNTEHSTLNTSSSLKHAMSEILSRLSYLNEVGLGYLTLDRPARTLSGGEIERVNLTTCLGASLTNTLFVLDEPTVGLHARDVNRLIKVMHNLRDKGNTVIVVEHEEAVMRQADNLIDIGPAAGEGGGNITFHGPLTGDLKKKMKDNQSSVTLPYLTGEKSIQPPKKRRKSRKKLKVTGAHKHNIHNQNIDIPIGTFTCLTGVSGSGKSTLANDVIYLNLQKAFLHNTEEDPAFIKSLKGHEHLAGVERVDQSPLTRTPRSTPAVYAGAFDAVRELFALTEEAESRAIKAGYFSFNSGAGRCERCAGNGFEKVEMQFLSDLYITCPECDGSRYNATALEVRYHGKSIADILALTITESLEFFAIEEGEAKSKALTLKSKISKALKPLTDVGLGYLRLGQPLNTLSGGESQRIKLCQLLTKTKKVTENGQLLILDEPTTGLHFTDIEKLLQVFQNLVNIGHTLLVIEHNLDIIRSADHLIEVGPGAGTHGGEITFTGTPEEILKTDTETSKALTVEEASSLFNEQSSGAATPNGDSLKRLEATSTRFNDESIPFTKKKSNLPHWTKKGATYAVILRLADSLPKSAIEAHTAQTSELKNQIQKAEATGNKELTRDFKGKLIEHYQTNLESALNKQEGNAWMIDDAIATIIASAIQHFDGDRYDLGAWCVMPNHVHMIIKPKEGHELSDILHSIKSFSAKEANKALNREGSFWQKESYDHVIRDQEDFYNQTKYIEKNPEVAGLNNWKWCNSVEEASSLFSDSPKGNIERKGDSLKRLEAASTNEIRISGARENNLKDIDITIPRDELVVVTGLSGSGKSTLAFDIIFAEGQRRFLDSMSPYARQFAGQMEKPDIDKIEGLPPTVAIEQRVSRGGGKSTVGTVTEIFHFLRLLYAKLGLQHCPDSGEAVVSQTIDAILAQLKKAFASKKRTLLLAPLIRGRKGYHTDVAATAARRGIELLLVDGKLVETANFTALARYKEHDIFAVISDNKKPTATQLDRALTMGRGQCATATELKTENWTLQTFSTERVSPVTGVSFPELDPHHFSFNSARGWCPECRGYGSVAAVSNRQAKTRQSKPNEYNSAMEAEIAEELGSSGDADAIKVTCPECKGDRLQTNARFVFIKDHNIAHISRLSVTEAAGMLEKWNFTDRSGLIARDIIPEITQRLRFLEKVGLNYLSLDRSADTLSGGESQRIRLAAQLGSNLTGVLYVLDEPTIGLHPRDNEQLLDTLEALRDRGNSLLIVEHDEETMKRATQLIDLGPGAGINGGNIVANTSGKKAHLKKTLKEFPDSPTLLSFSAPLKHPLHGKRRSIPKLAEKDAWLKLTGCVHNNLKDIDVRIPLGRLTTISGVSGCGKSSLMRGTLPAAMKASEAGAKNHKFQISNHKLFSKATGFENLKYCYEVDQSPIGKTSRSCPATYVKILDDIRKLFAVVPESRMRGYTASRFSFNNAEGQCSECKGNGRIKLEMDFLPTTWVPCHACSQKRYNQATLEIVYNGKTIGDVLEMNITTAAEFFKNHTKLHRTLSLLDQTGLGYLQLGQASPTLSGGEAQRLKLVAELTKGRKSVRNMTRQHTNLYLIEEPTIGLHQEDVKKLIEVLHRLVDEGHTVIVIEHHTAIMAEADYLIDMGPEAGEQGGTIVAQGTPEKVAKSKTSRTAKFLAEALG